MAQRSVSPITLSLTGSLIVAALLLCGPLLLLAVVGFRIGRWSNWANWAADRWKSGQQSEVVSGISAAVPGKIECGARWVATEPEFAYLNRLAQQGDLDEAAAICQRAAQFTLGCAPPTARHTRCFELDRAIMAEKCRRTCDRLACRAAKISCAGGNDP